MIYKRLFHKQILNVINIQIKLFSYVSHCKEILYSKSKYCQFNVNI